MTEPSDHLDIEAIIKGHLDFKERYSDLREIGMGGKGVVFQVKDNKLDKWVAIKVLHGNVDPKAVVRFQKEARALSMLKHRYIVGVLDFQSSKRAELFLIMEYVDGSSLEELVKKRGPLPLDEVAKYSIQLCEALTHAHEHGVVHRDLKPSNIMIDSKDNVRILDFGIAKMLTPENQFGTITRVGVPLGSLASMSPEQVRGDETDERTDVFGLGLLIYIMAAGRSPFDADQVLKYYQDLISESPPSLRLWIGESDTAHKLDGIVAKAMKSDPNERFQNMLEMRSALDSLVADPIEVLQVAHGPTEPSLAKRLSTPVILLVAGCLLVAFMYVKFLGNQPKDSGTASSAVKNGTSPSPPRKTDPYIYGPETKAKFSPGHENTKEIDMADFIFADETVSSSDLKSYDPPITKLSLSVVKSNPDLIRPLKPDMIEALTTLPLLALDLTHSDIKDSDLSEISKIKNLGWIRLDKTNITSSGIKNLLPLKPTLWRLDLDECKKVNDDTISCIVDNFPHIQSLHIGDTSVTRRGIKTLAKLKNLKSLVLSSLPVVDEDVRTLSQLDLVHFDVSNCLFLTDETVRILMPSKRLQYLELTNCRLINDPIAAEWERTHKRSRLMRGKKDELKPVSEALYFFPEDIK